MASRIPKDPALRQRRNKPTGGATLSANQPTKRCIPKLPPRVLEDGTAVDWHPMTLAWWRDTWRSPMSVEYLRADIHGLYRLAVLIDQFWRLPTKEMAAEIRLQQQAFGQSPLDRRRLQWEVERVEEVTRRRHPASVEPMPAEDPRKLLMVV